MMKNYKLALALLYFLQLLIVFRESVAEAYKHAVEAIHGRVEVVDADAAEHGSAARKGRHAPSEAPKLMIERAITAPAVFVMAHSSHAKDHEEIHVHHHTHHPETEDKERKMRRKRIHDLLIANLFPLFQRFAAPAQTEGIPAFALLRAISYPADAA